MTQKPVQPTHYKRIRRKAALCIFALIGVTCGPAPGQEPQDPVQFGKWDSPFNLPNVAIHVHVLPDGNVLFWGRREWIDNKTPDKNLDPLDCTPRLWNPADNTVTALPKPGFNLFCSGHTFLPDGRLLVVGGHLFDEKGEKKATIFDPKTRTWTRTEEMNGGRWYPTAITLADGRVLVSAGTDENKQRNDVQQIWKDGKWSRTQEFRNMPYYPRMHLATDGRIFMAGPLRLTQLLDTKGEGTWEPVGDRLGSRGILEYGTSVMYAPGKILFIGGGDPPSADAEKIDLDVQPRRWQSAGHMKRPRRHHNSTILPDGTVLVTSGVGGNGFNDLGSPAKVAELWNPVDNTWKDMAEEAKSRGYHSTAVLLPDARVLSAGGGEYRPDNINPNDPNDSRLDAQIFSPPYLFKATVNFPRPRILTAPAEVKHGQSFAVTAAAPEQVSRVTLVRLSSVTHSFNFNQRFNSLSFQRDGVSLKVECPKNPAECPPGHYMLFLLNQNGVPSIAHILNVREKF